MSKGVAVVACVLAVVLGGVLVQGDMPDARPADEATIIEIELLPSKDDPEAIPAELIEPRNPDPEQQAIERILRQRCRVRVRNAQVTEVLAAFEAKLGIPVRIEREILADEGINLDGIPRVSTSCSGLQVKRVIQRILSRIPASASCVDGELVIENLDRCEGRLPLLQYPVADLVAARNWNGIELQQLELKDLIESNISPDSWDKVGGPGSIRYEPTGMSLLIRQTKAIHEEIELILNLQREQRRRVPLLLKAAGGPTLEEVQKAEASDQLARRELKKIEEALRKLEEAPEGAMGGGFFDVVEGVVNAPEAAPADAGGFQCGGVFGVGLGFPQPPHAQQARTLAFRAMRLALRFEGVIPHDKNDDANNEDDPAAKIDIAP